MFEGLGKLAGQYKVTVDETMKPVVHSHILTPQGLKPDPCKVKGIVDMPDPTDAQSLCRFLGMVNYLAKFLPRLSEQKYRESSQRRMLSDVGFLPMLKLWPVKEMS